MWLGRRERVGRWWLGAVRTARSAEQLACASLALGPAVSMGYAKRSLVPRPHARWLAPTLPGRSSAPSLELPQECARPMQAVTQTSSMRRLMSGRPRPIVALFLMPVAAPTPQPLLSTEARSMLVPPYRTLQRPLHPANPLRKFSYRACRNLKYRPMLMRTHLSWEPAQPAAAALRFARQRPTPPSAFHPTPSTGEPQKIRRRLRQQLRQ